MRRIVMVLAALLCVVAARSEANAAQADVRLGMGLIFDNTVWGGGAAVDIAVKDKIKISPFFEYYKKSGATTLPFGANLKLAGPLGEQDKASFYVGAGVGAVRVDTGGAAAVTSTKLLIDGLVGLDIQAGEKASIFAEIRYLWGADNSIEEPGAFAGIKFGVGSSD